MAYKTILVHADGSRHAAARIRYAATLARAHGAMLLGDAGLHPRRADRAVILCALHRTLLQVEGGDIALGRQVADALDAVLTLPWDTAVAHVADAHVADAHVANAHVAAHALTTVPRRRARSRLRPVARAD